MTSRAFRNGFAVLLAGSIAASFLLAAPAWAQEGEGAAAAEPPSSDDAADAGEAAPGTPQGAADDAPADESAPTPDLDAPGGDDGSAVGSAGAPTEVEASATATQGELLPRHRIVYESLSAARLNPLGLEQRLSLVYRMRLWDDPGILFRDAHIGFGLTPTFSPSILRLGGGVQIKPLAVILLAANAYWMEWLGTYGYLQSYDSPNWPHADSDLDRGEELGLHYATSGLAIELQALLQAKVGPIAIANDLHFFYHDLDLRERDRVFYDIRIDTISPNDGWAFTNDTNLLWISDFGLVLGLRGTVTSAIYEDKHFPFGENQDVVDHVPSFRVGPLLAYVLSDDDERTAFSKPTVLAVVNWWVTHPYRTGEDVSQAYPYIVLGFKFGGELAASAL